MTLKQNPDGSYSSMATHIKDILTCRMSEKLQDKENLIKAMIVIQQSKPTTAWNQLARIGMANVLRDQKTALILDTVLGNKRKNKRQNIVEFE